MHSPPCAFSRREKDVPEAPFQRTLEAQSLTQVPFLVKLISPPKLGYLNDGSIMPSIHPLLRGYFAIATRFRLLPLRTRGVLASHPASWIDVQSLPRGCSFPMPIHWMRTCTSHQQISCVAVNLQPAHPHTFVCFGLTDRTRRMMLEKGGQSD